MLCSKLLASAFYYKTKLACHNFTIFDLNTKAVTCYFWHEGEGNLSSNLFASWVDHYFDSVLARDSAIKEFVLFSDGCTYQNRNVLLSNALLKLAVEKQIKITQKYLEKGHTYMIVDSVHSVIEHKVKNKPIYVPQHYIDAIKEVRQDITSTMSFLRTILS